MVQPRPTTRLIAVSGHCSLCQNDRVGEDRIGGTLREGERIEVECERNSQKRENERGRVDEICKETRDGECQGGKMPTITPPSVPSRFQLRARFMRLIPALFLPTSRPVARYPVRLYFKAVRRLFSYARRQIPSVVLSDGSLNRASLRPVREPQQCCCRSYQGHKSREKFEMVGRPGKSAFAKCYTQGIHGLFYNFYSVTDNAEFFSVVQLQKRLYLRCLLPDGQYVSDITAGSALCKFYADCCSQVIIVSGTRKRPRLNLL